MTDAQWKVKIEQFNLETRLENRAFRKKCVTQNIVTFERENGESYYTVRYRGKYVTTLWDGGINQFKLITMWNTIQIAEQVIKEKEQLDKEVEGGKHESK